MIHLQHQKKLTPFLSNALKCICFSSPVGRNEPSALCCRAPRAHPCSASTDGCTQPSPTSAANHPSASPPKSYIPAACGAGDRGESHLCASVRGSLLTSLMKSLLSPVPIPGQPKLLLSRDLPSSHRASSAGLSSCGKNTPTVPNIPSPEA